MRHFSSDRRGFMRRAALVIGAFVIGVGRSESVFGAHTCTYCRRKCTPRERNNCRHFLTWSSPSGGICVECYESASDVDKALEKDLGCYYCENVTCGYYIARERGDDDETVVPPVVETGVGCIDPETGAVFAWSEPGTPCDDRSAAQEYSGPRYRTLKSR